MEEVSFSFVLSVSVSSDTGGFVNIAISLYVSLSMAYAGATHWFGM